MFKKHSEDECKHVYVFCSNEPSLGHTVLQNVTRTHISVGHSVLQLYCMNSLTFNSKAFLSLLNCF